MNIPYVMKKCSKCGRWLVASTANFNKQAKGKYGLRSQCKECRSKDGKEYREAHKDKIAERRKQWYEANPEYNKQYRQANQEKLAEYGKEYREAHKDKIAKYNKEYRKSNKEKLTEYDKEYYLANRDDKLEYQKQYNEANREKIAEYQKQYNEANKEKLTEYKKQYNKQYSQTPQGQAVRFNASNKRRHKKEAQGTGVTPEQWLEMMQYFDWRCAYSGERLTDKTRSGDHIVPIDAGGDDMVWNMVPMLRNLNSSKQAKDMLEWYKKQDFYSEARLAKIYEWQEYARKKWKK